MNLNRNFRIENLFLRLKETTLYKKLQDSKSFGLILGVFIFFLPIIVVVIVESSKLREKDLEISNLELELRQLEGIYERDSTEYYDLTKNKITLERISREDYYMKAEDEEIYIIK